MRREFLGRRLIGLLALLLCSLAIDEEVTATTVCDTDPAAVRYTPTIDPILLNSVLDLLGEIPIDFTFDQGISFLYSHTLHLTVHSQINLEGVDFFVTPSLGSVRVQLNLPAWSANMTTSMSHAACRNCQAEYDSCVT